MGKNRNKILSTLLIVLCIISISINVYAHSGRTDANGGHRDNNNKSGLGSYHYHCGGYPAHLHTNGVCPYSSSSSSNQNSTSNSSTSIPASSTSTTTTTSTPIVPSDIIVEKIQINEDIESIEVGKSKTLTVTVTPSDATDKSITWKSSNESIATVSKKGEITAKKSGVVNITASSSNGKISTIKIDIKGTRIKEEIKTEHKDIVEPTKDDVTNDNQDDMNLLGGTVALALLGGGSYLGYKTYKNNLK